MASARSTRLFLQDILDSIGLINEYLEGMTRQEFEENIIVRDALERRIEIIAEAAKHIPAPLREAHPEIPWREVMSMRNFISHEYFAVNNESVWNVAQFHLAPLERTVSAMLAELPGEPNRTDQ